jgi:hypothetical protein
VRKDNTESRRELLRNVGTAAGSAIAFSTVVTADKKETDSSPSDKRELKKKQQKVEQEMQSSIKSAHQSSDSGLSTQDNLPGGGGSIPSIRSGEAYSTQSANYINSDSSIVGDEVGAAETDTKVDSTNLVNKSYALSHNYLAGDAWAWAETGIEFKALDGGRLELSGSCIYTASAVAGGTANANAKVIAGLYDTSTGNKIKQQKLYHAGSTLFPLPASRTDYTDQFIFEADVQADTTYVLVLRAATDTVSAGGDAWADIWNREHWADKSNNGYAQWTHLDINHLG